MAIPIRESNTHRLEHELKSAIQNQQPLLHIAAYQIKYYCLTATGIYRTVKSNDRNNIFEILSRSSPFFYMEKEDIALFANVARIVELESGTYLYREQQDQASVFVIVDGIISNSNNERDGGLHIEGFLMPGESFGWLSLADPGRRSATAMAHSRATVLTISQQNAEAALEHSPRIWKAVAKFMAERFRRVKTINRAIAAYELEQRMACILVQHFRLEAWTGAPLNEISISQKEIANLSVSSRQSVNKCLKNWESQGLVTVSYGKLRLLNANALRDLAHGSNV